MVSTVQKLCKLCSELALYNYPNNKGGIMCETHKLYTMIRVTNVLCRYPECKTLATFRNSKILNCKKYCAKHKEKGKLSISTKFCEEPDCVTSASYNFPTISKSIFCAVHKKIGMISKIKRKKTLLN